MRQLQLITASVLTMALMLHGLSAIVQHLPSSESESVIQMDDHGHSHDDLTDAIWAGHGHSHDLADHDHNLAVTLPDGKTVGHRCGTAQTPICPTLALRKVVFGLERPPKA